MGRPLRGLTHFVRKPGLGGPAGPLDPHALGSRFQRSPRRLGRPASRRLGAALGLAPPVTSLGSAAGVMYHPPVGASITPRPRTDLRAPGSAKLGGWRRLARDGDHPERESRRLSR